jgi:hypothetical protein
VLISLRLYKENNKLLYIFPLSSTHLWLRCSNFFNPPKKNSFGCAANRKIGNRKSQRLISTPTYLILLLSLQWPDPPRAQKGPNFQKAENGHFTFRLSYPTPDRTRTPLASLLHRLLSVHSLLSDPR